MHETQLQTEIRRSIQPLYDRLEALEKKLRSLEILCEVTRDQAWKDPNCSGLFTAFTTKMHSILKRG